MSQKPENPDTPLQVPLFPLNTVLFPGGPLPLRIFEARYIDMVRNCMRDDKPFGVALIADGQEAGPASTHSVGTLARITDFYQGSDGLLGITATGTERFRILDVHQQDDGLNIGSIERLKPEIPLALPDNYRPLVKILDAILDDFGKLYDGLERHYDDAGWVANRFVEVLPISLPQKQFCLEKANQQQRLQIVEETLEQVRMPAPGQA